jgi:hypothetical protein
MNKNKFFCTTFAILIYIILLIIYRNSIKNHIDCDSDVNCIRFCSTDSEKYSDEYLKDNFKLPHVENWFKIKNENYKVLRGRPTCLSLTYVKVKSLSDYNNSYELTYVSITTQSRYSWCCCCCLNKVILHLKNKKIMKKILFRQYGSVYVDGEKYKTDRYCFDKDEGINGGWRLMICFEDKFVQRTFHIICKS